MFIITIKILKFSYCSNLDILKFKRKKMNVSLNDKVAIVTGRI